MASIMKDKLEKVATVVGDTIRNAGSTGPQSNSVMDKLAEGVVSERVSEGGRSNQSVVYTGDRTVEVIDMGYPKMVNPQGIPVNHGVILKVIVSGICGSDLHMYRGRTTITAADRMVFGHEITGEIAEMGSDVTQFHVGDWVSVPFNVACGRCQNCKERKTSLCLNTNPLQPAGLYGYAMGGNWRGGQSQYVFVPFADFNLVSLYTTCQPDPKGLKKHEHNPASKDKILQHIIEVATLSDILPTGMNGAVQARVGLGSTVYIAGAGPVGLCCAVSCFLLGASKVIIGDPRPQRLEQAKLVAPGCEVYTIDLSKIEGGISDSIHISEKIKELTGEDTVDSAVDCVGFEACGCGRESDKNVAEQVLNTCFAVVKAGGAVGIPGVYLPADPKGADTDYKQGLLPLRYGVAFNKGITIEGGQCPVLKHAHALLKLVLANRVHLSHILNPRIISLAEAPEAYKQFDHGVPNKFLIDPNGILAQHNAIPVNEKGTQPETQTKTS